MQKILEYIKQSKLGAAVLPPFKKFDGVLAAKVKRSNGEFSFIASKWNPDKERPDVAYDPMAFRGQVVEFIELYAKKSNVEEDDDEDTGAGENMTIPQITARLVELGMAESDAKKLGNKQAKFEKMKELEEEFENKKKEYEE